MNQRISKTGAALVALTVFLFSIFMIVDFPFGSYLVCMFLPIGYIMMAAGFHYESAEEQRVSANVGLIFPQYTPDWFSWYIMHRPQA